MAPKVTDQDKVSTTKQETNTNFFQQIIDFFTGFNNPEAEKRRQLKVIAREIHHSSYSKFYRPKTFEALPTLARFFYDTYRIVAPAQVQLENASKSGALKAFVIDSFLTSNQKAVLDALTDTKIMEQANSMSLKQLQEYVKNNIQTLDGIFDAEKVNQINKAYNTLLTFLQFVNYDYYFLLKKFDSRIIERSFSYTPKFEAISCEYIADDMAEFVDRLLVLNLDADWKRILEALKQYRNIELIQIDSWLKHAQTLKAIRQSGILENIIRHCKQDPNFKFILKVPNEQIVDPYIDKIKNQANALLQKIMTERKTSKIEELAQFIFGTVVVLRMKNYTEKANANFSKRNLAGYSHTEPLNYVKAYLIDYLKKDVRELIDLLIVRGQWITNVQSQEVADAFHNLLQISELIVAFDDDIGDDGSTGSRIRSLLARSDRDRDQLRLLKQLIKVVNDKALELIKKTALNLISLGKYLHALINDQASPSHTIITNWKELDNYTESRKTIKELLIHNYKKLYAMVQLLNFYVNDSAV